MSNRSGHTGNVKVAVRRDEAPIGEAAQMYIVCECGKRLDVGYPNGPNVECQDCGRIYTAHGWLVSHLRRLPF